MAAALAAMLGTGTGLAQPAPATTGQDVQVMARALSFLQPPPSNEAWVAVVFAANDPASRRDADRIAALFGGGLRAGGTLLHARAMAADALAGGGAPAALIPAAGAPVDAVMAAARARHALCVTPILADVEAGRCTMWVRTDARVQIVVNQAAAQSCGIGFAAAFRMMVREL